MVRPEIAEVGAGIQMATNAARILGRFDSLRRYKNDEEIGSVPLMPEIGEKYHAPLPVIHRGDLQGILLQGAKDEGVNIRTSSKVVKCDDSFEARVQLTSGEWVEGDVIIAADGIKSDIRRQMADHHGIKDRNQPTGDAAYRILIPKDRMPGDERALRLLEYNVGMRLMGPYGHIMTYPVKGKTLYKMVLLHPQKPEKENEESWTNKGDKKEMLDFLYGVE